MSKYNFSYPHELMQLNPTTGKFDTSLDPRVTRHYDKHYAAEVNSSMIVHWEWRWGSGREEVEFHRSEYQWVRQPNPDWQNTLEQRFYHNQYTRPPFPDHITPIPDHFAHVSEDGTKIVFIADATKHGPWDRTTSMLPGRYLRRYYPDLSADDIKNLACLVDKMQEVKFGVTEDDFERVYDNGPGSCMNFDDCCDDEMYNSPFHPVRMYAAGDLQIAYLEGNGRITARALVWPDKKIYSRIYGDDVRLSTALKKLGYESGLLTNARIKKVEHEGLYVAPYIDYTQGLYHSKCGEFFIIGGESGMRPTVPYGDFAFHASRTDGLSDDPVEMQYCPVMDEHYNPNQVAFHYVSDAGEHWSEFGIERDGFYCTGYNLYYSNETPHYPTPFGRTWSQDYVNNLGFVCPRNGFAYRRRDGVILIDTDEMVNLDWAHTNAFQDPETLQFYAVDPSSNELAEVA